MKWNISINQRRAIALGLKNTTEAIILGMISDCHGWAEPQIIDESIFYWIARQELVRQLPLLDLKEDTVYRYLKNLERLGLIEYKKHRKKDCVRLTKLGKSYSMGKKSASAEKIIPEKNPNKLGEKSGNYSDNNPTDTSIISYSLISHTPQYVQKLKRVLILQESEIQLLPLELQPFDSDLIQTALFEMIFRKQGIKDAIRYAKKLKSRLLEGDRLTIQNLKTKCEKLRNEQFADCLFDFYASIPGGNE